MAYAKLPVHLGVHLGRELQVVEVFVIHAVERLGAIEEQVGKTNIAASMLVIAVLRRPTTAVLCNTAVLL